MLSAKRTYNEAGPAPISMESLKAYFEIYGIKEEESIADYMLFIDALDRVFLKKQNERRTQEINAAKGRARGRQRSSSIRN